MQTRDTLREFSIDVTNVKGNKFHIEYGYDLSKSKSSFYVRASIDGKTMSSCKATLNRVRSLDITPINRLIDLLGCDETGIQIGFEDEIDAALADIQGIDLVAKLNNMMTLLRIEKSDTKAVGKLAITLNKVLDLTKQGKSGNVIKNTFMRYVKTQRLRLLMDVRETTQSLRKLFYKGVEIAGEHCTVNQEGYLKANHYPTYYKRDMNLIRSSRIRIYREVLKREYVPVKD